MEAEGFLGAKRDRRNSAPLLQLLERIRYVDIAAFEFHWNRDESAFVGTDGIDEEKNIVTSFFLLSFNFAILERQVCVHQDSTGNGISVHVHLAFVSSSARINEVFFAHF